MVVLGELGGRDEYSLVEALKQGNVNKPVVAWVSGTCARLFKSEVQFDHAVSGCSTILHLSILSSSCHCRTRGTFFNLPCDIVHQGAKSGGELESAQAKTQALKDAGAVVPTSYEAFETAIRKHLRNWLVYVSSSNSPSLVKEENFPNQKKHTQVYQMCLTCFKNVTWLFPPRLTKERLHL